MRLPTLKLLPQEPTLAELVRVVNNFMRAVYSALTVPSTLVDSVAVKRFPLEVTGGFTEPIIVPLQDFIPQMVLVAQVVRGAPTAHVGVHWAVIGSNLEIRQAFGLSPGETYLLDLIIL